VPAIASFTVGSPVVAPSDPSAGGPARALSAGALPISGGIGGAKSGSSNSLHDLDSSGRGGGVGTDAEALLATDPDVDEKARLEAMARRQVIMAILFADIVGYSKLQEMQVLVFIERFLGSVAALLDELPPKKRPRVKNTWGDALYLLFSKVRRHVRVLGSRAGRVVRRLTELHGANL
jgi:class 3 adenylate cyclase